MLLNFLGYLLDEIKKLENVRIRVLDVKKVNTSKKKAYSDFVKNIKQDMKQDDNIFTLCLIIGISELAEDDIIDEDEFDKLLGKVKGNGKHSFIIVDDPSSLEDHTYDSWYSDFINQDSGIWIGNGIENQTLINTNFSMDGLENNCGNSYGYVTLEGIPTLVKFIGIEEEGDED